MKKITTLFSAVLLTCLFYSNAYSQLNGVYTIDNTQPSSATNFTSFTAFSASLTASGVSGPVTANVGSTSGPYNEQVNFTQAAGISSTNTITINGNGRTITFNATVATLRHTLMLTGADYMTFNNLVVAGTNSANAMSCHLWAGANNNAFNNCVFNSPLTGTGTGLVPFSISGTSVSATATGNSGDNNTVTTCTTNGGYYGLVFYGASSAPFNLNNTVSGSSILDFYTTGIYNGYSQNTIIRNNILERLNRTTVTSTEAIYLTTGTIEALVDGNHVRHAFGAVAGSTSTFYGIYSTADAVFGRENVIVNNIISDINSNGTLYGIYLSAAPYHRIIHNTISLDGSTATGGNTRGIFLTGASTNCIVKNNIVYITRTGSGIKYALYYTAAANVNLTSDYNVLHLNSSAGTNNLAWLVNDYATLSAWQTGTGLDMNSYEADPVFTNPGLMNFVPTSTLINNVASPMGISIDFTKSARNLLMPDPGALEFYNSPCIGAPPTAAFVTPNVQLCPGTVLELKINNVNTFTNSGYAIQWFSGTSSVVGPFASIPAANSPAYITPAINVITYYNVAVTCTLAAGTTTSAVQTVSVAPTVTNSVPYLESFETLVYSGLPNCSWSVSDPGGKTLVNTSVQSNNRVPRTGTNYATFENNTTVNYFYSNGIEMFPGITYSASVWYITDATGFNNWSNLNLSLGTTQAATSLTNIATVSPVSPVLYTPLSNTFTVNSPGLYFLAVSATGSTGVSPFLTFDDLAVIIPCSLNSPNASISVASNTVCSGALVNLQATGAGSYTWSTGSTGPILSINASSSTIIYVVAENILSGCTSIVSQPLVVNPKPNIVAVSNPPAVCAGSSAVLTAQGNEPLQFQWMNGQVLPQITVTPAGSTIYFVTAVNAFGCANTTTTSVTVNSLPLITVLKEEIIVCRGEAASLQANGATTYQWTSDQQTVYNGNPANIFPMVSGVYTVTGTNNNGCSSKSQIVVGVEECTGLENISLQSSIRIFPNPSGGLISLVFEKDEEHEVTIFDMNSRLIETVNLKDKESQLDLTEYSAGTYYAKVQTASGLTVVKIIKL